MSPRYQQVTPLCKDEKQPRKVGKQKWALPNKLLPEASTQLATKMGQT